MNFIEKKKKSLVNLIYEYNKDWEIDFGLGIDTKMQKKLTNFLEATVKEAVNESFRVMESTEGYTKSYLDRVRNEIIKKMGL